MSMLDRLLGGSPQQTDEEVRQIKEAQGVSAAEETAKVIAEHFRPGDGFTFMGKFMTVRRVFRRPQFSRLELWFEPPTVQAIYENKVGKLCEFTLTTEEALRLIEQGGTSLTASRQTPESGA